CAVDGRQILPAIPFQITAYPARCQLAEAVELPQRSREGHRGLTYAPVPQPFRMLRVSLQLNLMVRADIQLPQPHGSEVPAADVGVGAVTGDGLIQRRVALGMVEVVAELVRALAVRFAGGDLPVQALGV